MLRYSVRIRPIRSATPPMMMPPTISPAAKMLPIAPASAFDNPKASTSAGIVSEIHLLDANEKMAQGEALDLKMMTELSSAGQLALAGAVDRLDVIEQRGRLMVGVLQHRISSQPFRA